MRYKRHSKTQERAVIKDYQLGDIPDFASLIFVRVYGEVVDINEEGKEKVKRAPRGFVFVKNEKEFGPAALEKMAGGHPKAGETPLDTAVRELLGETNLSPPLEAFSYVCKWLGERGDHWKCLFTADIHERDLAWMNSNHPENEGEVPAFFTMDELLELVRQGKFMDEHFAKLVELGLILPGPAQATAAA